MQSNNTTSAANSGRQWTNEEIEYWQRNGKMPSGKLSTYNPSHPPTPSTYGPTFDLQLDDVRLGTQLKVIADLMADAFAKNKWLSLAEIEEMTGYPSASISAQLRHLRKPQFGAHMVDKRRRAAEQGGRGGTWEYLVIPNGCSYER